MNRRLVAEPLTKAAFAPWGDVVERAGAETRVINDGSTDRLHALASIDVGAGNGRPIVSIFAGRRRPHPLSVTILERHPLGSQCFFPLQPFDWLVVVGDPAPDKPPRLRCFRAGGDQGVNYAAGAWHHPLLLIEPRQDFLVIDREGPGANCEEIAFPEHLFTIDIEGTP